MIIVTKDANGYYSKTGIMLNEEETNVASSLTAVRRI